MAKRPVPSISPRRPVNTKLSDDIRARLQAVADASDRTLSHEIEYRLEQSMRVDSQFGDAETAAVLRELAGYIIRAERLEQRKLLDTVDHLSDNKFDAHIRWLLGEIVSFKRMMRRPVDYEEAVRLSEADDEANSAWTDEDGSQIKVDIPKPKA